MQAGEDQETAAQVPAVSQDALVDKLTAKYISFLDGTGETGGEVLPEWRIENRQVKLETQGISKETARERALEAVDRTRQRYITAFLADGVVRSEAESRAEGFLSDPARCLDIVWREERARFEEEEKTLDTNSKNLVALVNLAAAPFVLYYAFHILPFNSLMEMARFYTSNNCQAIGGIKCNDQNGELTGPQGQRLPSLLKVLTPPAKIKRQGVTPLSRVVEEVDESGSLFPE